MFYVVCLHCCVFLQSSTQFCYFYYCAMKIKVLILKLINLMYYRPKDTDKKLTANKQKKMHKVLINLSHHLSKCNIYIYIYIYNTTGSYYDMYSFCVFTLIWQISSSADMRCFWPVMLTRRNLNLFHTSRLNFCQVTEPQIETKKKKPFCATNSHQMRYLD